MSLRGLAIALVAASTACGASRPAPHTANSSIAATGPKREQGVEAAARRHGSVAALTPDVVLATIKDRYLPGVERCYQRHAKLHGTGTGRVLVSFTVDEQGKTRDGEAHGIARRVDGCIAAQVARWQFPAPRAESSFALGLQLDTE
jgi:hypothetical protein